MAKRKSIKPDETWSFGPLQFARFGRFVMMRNVASPEELAEFRRKTAAARPALKAEIDANIAKLRAVLQTFNPIQLLTDVSRRNLLFDPETYEEPSSPQKISHAEYALSLAMATTWGDKDMTAEVSKEFNERLAKLFIDVMHYFGSEVTSSDEKLELAEVKMTQRLSSLLVRGDWVPQHLQDHVIELFEPHDSALQASLTVTVRQLVDALDELEVQFHSRLAAIHEFYDTLEEARTQFLSKMGDAPTKEAFDEYMHGEDLAAAREKAQKAFDKMGDSPFEVTPNTRLPQQLLEKLSLEPGQNAPFNLEKSPGWPLNDSICWSKPFTKHGNRYYCFVPTLLQTQLTSVLEAAIRDYSGDYFQHTYEPARSAFLEQKAAGYLQQLLPGASVILGATYEVVSDGGPPQVFECDALLIRDEVVIAVEAKAGAVSMPSKRGGLARLEKEFDALVKDPFRQGARALEFLGKNAAAKFKDRVGHEHVIDGTRLMERHIVTVTLSPFGPVLPRLNLFRDVGMLPGDDWPWAVFLGDLRVASEMLEGPGEFLLYLARRKRALDLGLMDSTDELDFLMIFLREGLYLEDGLPGGAARMSPVGYTVDLDSYYAHKAGTRQKPAEKPRLRVEDEIRELARKVERLKGGPIAAAALLSIDEPGRRRAMTFLSKIVAKSQEDGSSHNFTIGGGEAEVGLTFATFPRPDQQAIQETFDYCESKMESLSCKRWHGVVVDIFGDPVAVLNFWPDTGRSARVKASGKTYGGGQQIRLPSRKPKLGRNDRCSCGSGLKYKKCCLLKED